MARDGDGLDLRRILGFKRCQIRFVRSLDTGNVFGTPSRPEGRETFLPISLTKATNPVLSFSFCIEPSKFFRLNS